MFESVIATKGRFEETQEMLIPKVVGKLREGYINFRRLNRMLVVGRRCRNYNL